MAKQRLRFKDFSGGLSDDTKQGPKNSASSALAIDFRRSAAQAGLLRRLVKESGSVITTEIHDAVRVYNGDVYLAGGTFLYKRTASANGGSGTWSAIAVSAGVYDLDYRPDLETLFLYGTSTISEYGPLKSLSTPTLKSNKYTNYTIITQTGTGGSWGVLSTIDETQKFEFIAKKDPIASFTVKILTRTVGGWQFTVHDEANNIITQAGSGGTTTGDVTFPVTGSRYRVGTKYHLHITSSSPATNTIQTGAANSLATADIKVNADRMVDSSSIIYPNPYRHATYQSGATTYFCNERYLGQWEILSNSDNSADGYDPCKLIFPANYLTCGITEYSEYLVIAAGVKENSDTGDTRGSSGMLFFWDKVSEFYNFAIPVQQGVPEGVYNYNNAVYFIASGMLMRWAGNDIETVYQFPGVDDFGTGGADAPQVDNALRAPRHAMTSWKGLLLVAFPYLTANALIEYGVYSFGRQKSFMPNAIGQDYLISTGSGTVKFNPATSPDTPITSMSMLKAFGNNLLVGWRDYISGATTYGVDKLNDASPFATDAIWRSLWFDNSDPDILKTPIALKITFEPLQAGCEVTPLVQYDRSDVDVFGIASDGTSTIKATQGNVDVVLPLEVSDKFYEIMVGYNVTGNGTDDVRINSVTLVFDDNRENTEATKDRRATD